MTGTRATCFICDKAIEPERLATMPDTLFCGTHAQKRACQKCDSDIEADRITRFPETLYCAAHALNDRVCQICACLIECARREAVPNSSLCHEHATLAYKYGGEFRREVKRVKLGKPGISGGKGSDIETAKSINKDAIAKARDEYLKSQS